MSKQSERLFKAISNLNDEMIDPALEPRKRRKTRPVSYTHLDVYKRQVFFH